MDFAGWKFKHRMAFIASDSRVDFAPLELPTARFQQSFEQKNNETRKKLMRMHNEENLHLQLAQKAISTNIFGILKFKIIHKVGYLKRLHVRSLTLYYDEWKSLERNESENCHAFRSALTVNYCYEMRRIYGFLGLFAM